MMPPATQTDRPQDARRRRSRWAGIVFALAFPTLITWGYFVLADDFSSGTQQATYLVVKTIQFAFPLVWVWAVLRERVGWRRPNSQGLILGAAFGIAVVGAGLLVYVSLLRGTVLFAEAGPLIRDKLAAFDIESLWQYVVLAGFYSLLHSLLEEYYWRWFVFGQLRQLVPLWSAISVSAAAFAGHHVVVLCVYFGGWSWTAVLLSAAVAAGGVFWAWLYERSGSLLGPWLSHLLIDAGVFWIGYDLIRETLQGS